MDYKQLDIVPAVLDRCIPRALSDILTMSVGLSKVHVKALRHNG